LKHDESLLRRALMMAGLGAWGLPAAAETYPSKSITIMPLLAAGTGLDVTVRLYAEQLSQAFGKPVVVENKPGSAGLVGIAALKAAPADGYTLIVATSAVMAIRPTLLKSVPYDAQRDFIPIALYVKSPFILVVDPKLPIHSVPELIKYVKERPAQLSYSSSGVGGAPHLSAEYMKQRFDIDLAHVPYRNSPQSITDVAAGHVAMAATPAHAQQINAALSSNSADGEAQPLSVEEIIVTQGREQQVAHVIATNAYVKTPAGWKMVLHHASPAPGGQAADVSVEPHGTLH